MRVTIVVYDLLGRKTAVLADGVMSAGHHMVAWDGRDYAGKQAGAGVYLYMVRAGSLTRTGKMTLMR